MVNSNSPAEGGRRARLAAERLARETPSQDAEVLDSRRSRRAANRSTPDVSLPTPAAARPVTSVNLFSQAEHFWTEGPVQPEPTRSAPLTRRELAQRSGRRSAAPRTEQLPKPADDRDSESFKAFLTPADGISMETPSTGSVPVTRASRRSKGTAPSPSGPGSSGPSTTELQIVRGRRAARPQTSRRRVELALGRSMSNRRVWGGVLAIAMVMLVPGASMLQSSVTVADGGLSGSGADLAALQQFPDSTRFAQPAETTAAARARAKAKATASAVATAAEKATAEAAAKNKKKTPGRTPSSGNTGRITNDLSGLPWASGVFSRGQGVGGVKSFGDWRGAAVDVVIDWPARQTWDDIVNPSWLYSTWKGTPYTKVFGVAPVPEGDGSATMSGCAAGDYNDKWKQFGTNIKNAGLDDETVIRLGWEFNGDWYKWQASDPKQFAECWRQIVGSAESTAPALLWDWNVNRGKGASVVDAREAYPGDSYVDIVGIDSYDMWPGVTNEAEWARQYSGPYGLKFWSDFAKDHGKRISVAEWGVYPGPSSGGSSGGDNAFYITKMQGFFKSQGSHLAYEAYFNESADYIAGSIFGPTQNPVAAAKYKSLFGS